MLRKTIWRNLVILGFLLSLGSGVASAQMPAISEQTSQFHSIEQPLELKAVVTLSGVALIGVELWWFLLSRNQAQQARQLGKDAL